MCSSLKQRQEFLALRHECCLRTGSTAAAATAAAAAEAATEAAEAIAVQARQLKAHRKDLKKREVSILVSGHVRFVKLRGQEAARARCPGKSPA